MKIANVEHKDLISGYRYGIFDRAGELIEVVKYELHVYSNLYFINNMTLDQFKRSIKYRDGEIIDVKNITYIY